eukprot:TRINITY_DN15373_c0_g1::TRINITY_DN15373_c0_g1_i1::g.22739::m.22739 TRINITY_DN15373_c0_g1::TRINITY_DN15373_c0_g1_i1::g.22739  ORF type:complete len:486 (+),score=156.74,sp/O74212/D5FAD_MORAP/46.31/9e-136,FA_desaturase/PF00487.19/7.4e-30,Cyt-b5/PF00173.23/4.3e-24 TRINITY_DN15373_c0_g1_i1:110-1567(+)
MCRGTSSDSTSSKERTFTWEELAKHNKPNDAYIAVRGNVYKVTDFIKRHPGGSQTLLLSAGRDATQVFESYHKPEKLKDLLKKLYVGKLVTDELPTFPEPNLFARTLRKRVEDMFEQKGIDPKFSWRAVFMYCLIYFTVISCWYMEMFTFRDNLFGQILAGLGLGLGAAFVGLMPQHDGSHFSFTHSPLVWNLMMFSHDMTNGASSYNWMYQHILGHHPYTNIDGADPDIWTNTNDFRRIKWVQPWIASYAYQHIYVPLLYYFLAFKTRIQDISLLFVIRSNGAIRMNETPMLQMTVFTLGKLSYLLTRIVIPCYLLGFSRAMLLMFVNDITTSYWLALSFQCSHVVGEVNFLDMPEETVDEQGRKKKTMPIDWYEMQVGTTQDYGHHSTLTNFAVGHLNHQITHHVFPGILQFHYPLISPIVQQTCKEFGVTYYYQETFWDALRAHMRYLYDLGHFKTLADAPKVKSVAVKSTGSAKTAKTKRA